MNQLSVEIQSYLIPQDPVTSLPVISFCGLILKNSIFQQRLNNLNELLERIVTKIDKLNKNPQMLANIVSTATVRIVQKGLEVSGEHFDYLL
ncbi:hypothetical protein BDFB_003415 [Asbolus verrucosus]|uniref:Uncharacterized protein n=1 Tax=Asbolus verrucosus TaxID=1661398 RepID=A0A482W5V7_ASBVE|nr:hypothetical protein BDFB_003415 [Asbolus verrucosus]